ncbi:MAG: hypothetical protein LBS41_02235 [Streptococcaceae bacterium]|jgi:hypothetical protein|nr:hypothetical protein [Streptococcaceae bacterium]
MDYVELAIKSGGFMAMDRVFLNNRLAELSSDRDKLAYIMPPASVINAYFAEIYQKQGPEAATDYFLDLMTTFKGFSDQPSFDLEGHESAPTFRLIRLNLSGKSFGFAFQNEQGQALIVSELADEPITDALLFEVAQLFPHYVIRLDAGKLTLGALDFEPFGSPVDLDELTSQAENERYIKLTTFNIAEGITHYQGIVNHSRSQAKMVQYEGRAFNLYIRK